MLLIIYNESKRYASKLQKNLKALNFETLVLNKVTENISSIIHAHTFEVFFIENSLYGDNRFLEKIKTEKQQEDIPIIVFYEKKPENATNIIEPDRPENILSSNFSFHELQLVLEKAIQEKPGSKLKSQKDVCEINHYRQITERYAYIYEHTGLGIFQSTLQGKFISVNKALSKMLGYPSGKELIESIYNISSQIYVIANERETILQTLHIKKNIFNYKVKCRRKDGIIIMLKVHFRLITDNISKTQYIEGIAEDYTYHNRAKDALKDNILQLKEYHNLARLGSFQKNFLLNKYSFSENFFEIIDIVDDTEKRLFTEETLFKITHAEDRELLKQIWISGFSQKLTGFKSSFRICGSKGKIIHLNLEGIIQYNHNYEAVNMYIAIQDITEQKLAEEQLKVSLAEKEILLREINHRVKNNLQVVASILNLQSTFIKDKKTIEILNECKNRVFSMSLVHEKLCQSDNLARIDYQVYLKELLSNITQSYNLKNRNIYLKLKICDAFFPIDIAIPCGMIINELVSNALKYAFPDNIKGEITVSLLKKRNNYWELCIIDNGIGFLDKFDREKTETLGLKLVDSLVEQINGSIKYLNNKGVKAIISFKEKI